MVVGKVVGVGFSLIAVLIAIIIFVRVAQGLNIGEQLSNAGKGFQDFFNSLIPPASGSSDDDESFVTEEDERFGDRTTETTINPDGSETVKVVGTTFERTKEKQTKEELAREKDFTFDEAIKALDPNDPDFQKKALALAEAEGITGVDEITINEAGGISFKQFDRPTKDNDFNFNILPQAFADEGDSIEATPNLSKDEEELAKIKKETSGGFKGKSERFTDQQIKDIESLRTNKGLNIINFDEASNDFEVFQAEGSKGFVGAVIRPTPIDRTKLMEGETASERANRVFEETGDFVDVNRGATSIKDREPFDFGTNTGSGQKGGTEADTKKSLQQRLAEEAEKARLIFDSSLITRF